MTEILWAPIDMKTWRETPVLRGRVATERDEEEGRAVFHIPASGSRPHDVRLPALAIVREDEVGEPTPVIVVQAETPDDETVAIGYRLLDGGSGICALTEVECLDEPHERFE